MLHNNYLLQFKFIVIVSQSCQSVCPYLPRKNRGWIMLCPLLCQSVCGDKWRFRSLCRQINNHPCQILLDIAPPSDEGRRGRAGLTNSGCWLRKTQIVLMIHDRYLDTRATNEGSQRYHNQAIFLEDLSSNIGLFGLNRNVFLFPKCKNLLRCKQPFSKILTHTQLCCKVCCLFSGLIVS